MIFKKYWWIFLIVVLLAIVIYGSFREPDTDVSNKIDKIRKEGIEQRQDTLSRKTEQKEIIDDLINYSSDSLKGKIKIQSINNQTGSGIRPGQTSLEWGWWNDYNAILEEAYQILLRNELNKIEEPNKKLEDYQVFFKGTSIGELVLIRQLAESYLESSKNLDLQKMREKFKPLYLSFKSYDFTKIWPKPERKKSGFPVTIRKKGK